MLTARDEYFRRDFCPLPQHASAFSDNDSKRRHVPYVEILGMMRRSKQQSVEFPKFVAKDQCSARIRTAGNVRFTSNQKMPMMSAWRLKQDW